MYFFILFMRAKVEGISKFNEGQVEGSVNRTLTEIILYSFYKNGDRQQGSSIFAY